MVFDLNSLKVNLYQNLDHKLVDELLSAYEESKRKFYLGQLRPNEVEGGRFCEAAFRLLELITTGTFTQLGKQLNTDALITQLAKLPSNKFSDSVRLHIPRSLRVVYDIRNKRDAAHLADSIDPNLQDATLVISILDWALAEFIRMYHSVSADEAQRIVENLVTRQAPAIQIFGNFPKVLNPNLKASDYVLLLLYHCGASGAQIEDLRLWIRPKMLTNLNRTLDQLVDEKAFAHKNGNTFFITYNGQREIELRHLYDVR